MLTASDINLLCRRVSLMVVACLGALWLAACAVPPATVHRRFSPSFERQNTEVHLHHLIAEVVESPGTPGSKRALGLLVEQWNALGLEPTHTFRPISAGSVSYRVKMAGMSAGCYPIEYFDELRPAEELKIGRIAHYHRDGLGAPLVAVRANRMREPIERFYPPEAITRPLTAFATAGPVQNGIQEVTIQLLCPLMNDSVRTENGREPLAADFSAPWATLLARTRNLHASGLLDALTPNPSRPSRLYLMEPYDPRKEPLIMIHGLFSTPLIWAEISNELWADPEIRRRYQIWHYHYNTSAPALYSARILRQQLKEVRALLDPSGKDPAMRKTTILAHSMGGLIAKAMVVRPGDVFWEAAFTVPHHSLKLSPDDRAMLDEAFEWEPDRSVRRIVFVAVPHRGSDYADNALGRLGRRLTDPPETFRTFYERISEANPGAFTTAYEELGSGRLDSVSSLSPSQPTLQILADLPVAHPVKIHSIIGNRGRPGPLVQSSDGVVPYSSSHLKSVDSELIVPANHWSYNHPAAVAEIKRSLKLR